MNDVRRLKSLPLGHRYAIWWTAWGTVTAILYLLGGHG